jgi:hypothetical protein
MFDFLSKGKFDTCFDRTQNISQGFNTAPRTKQETFDHSTPTNSINTPLRGCEVIFRTYNRPLANAFQRLHSSAKSNI